MSGCSGSSTLRRQQQKPAAAAGDPDHSAVLAATGSAGELPWGAAAWRRTRPRGLGAPVQQMLQQMFRQELSPDDGRNADSAVPQQCTAGGSSPASQHDLVFPAGPINGTVVQKQFLSHLQPIGAGQNRQNRKLCVGCARGRARPNFKTVRYTESNHCTRSTCAILYSLSDDNSSRKNMRCHQFIKL